MKKIEIIIEPSYLEKMKECMDEAKIRSFHFSEILRFEADKKVERNYRGASYQKTYQQRVKIESFVNTQQSDKLIECLTYYVKSGTLCVDEIILYDIMEMKTILIK